ncbi:MAG: hypothetical protein P8I93_09395 [Crocinitomicaceae bacterium]|nr:hypothetical protein [Crocinitomicaceae bacterium]
MDEILSRKEIISVFDGIGIKFMWSELDKISQKGEMGYFLHACKIPPSGKADVGGKHIKTASTGFNSKDGEVTVDLTMTSEGSNKWHTMTSNNVGKAIAITMDDIVLSAPKVNGTISGGNTQISGRFTFDEANDIAYLLKNSLPKKTKILITEINYITPKIDKAEIKKRKEKKSLNSMMKEVFEEMKNMSNEEFSKELKKYNKE